MFRISQNKNIGKENKSKFLMNLLPYTFYFWMFIGGISHGFDGTQD